MKKKILSIALALCMVLTMMPMATGVAWADTASGVYIGGTSNYLTEGQYYHNGENGAFGEINDTSTGANATFSNGTLTLNGLNLTSGSGSLISATGDLTIKLEDNNNIVGSNSYPSNVISVTGNLTISGPDTGTASLTAENGNNSLSTIYATNNIKINGGAQVTATHASGGAQVINAKGGNIEISGENTIVDAQTGSAHALLAGDIQGTTTLYSIKVSEDATLIAISGDKAVRGTVDINIANSKVTAGETKDAATLWPSEGGSSELSDLNNYKYLKIEPKAPVSTALEDVTFNYAYDAYRRPDFPAKAGDTIEMYNLGYPLDANKNHMSTNVGNWTLVKAGTYSFIKNNNEKSENLDSIVGIVSGKYSTLDQNAIVIHELKNGETHIAYGIVIAYNDTEGHAVFIGDNWNSEGSGYLLSTNVVTAGSIDITAGTIATDFVQKLSIDLDHTGTHDFTSQTAETVKITNTGNDETGNLTVKLSGDDANSFLLGEDDDSDGTISISSIAEGGNDTFTVAPITGLTAGTYTATVTVIGQNIVAKSFNVNFAVEADTAPSNPGGSYTPTIQHPTIIADEGAETTLSIFGDKLTIKVADDYELADVILNGVSKGKVTELSGLKTGDTVEVKTEKKQEEPKEPTKEEIIAVLKEQQLVARSKLTTSKSGRKAILITWYDKNGNEVAFDGVEIFRSTKRNSGYGNKPIFVSKTGKYYNTAVTEGTRYYYKVRGYVIIDGQKYYTEYSLKAIRTFK